MDLKNKILIVAAVIIGVIGLYNNIKSHTTVQKVQTNIAPQPTNSELLLSNKNTEIVTSDVLYFKDIHGTDIKGFYAHPKTGENYPGIVMVHEWWGLNDNVKDMAKELAKEGYQVLAVDLYKGSVAKTTDQARTYVSSVQPEESLANMQAAVQFLEDKNASKIATLGWCFGGGQSLQLSLNTPLDATVIYYGTPLITDKSQLGSITWPVLGIFGDKDMAIPVSKVNEFHAALDDLKIHNQILIYPGVGHAFANPTGQSWAPRQTRDAWKKTIQFLQENLKG